MDKLIEKAKILTEALPYIREFAGKTVVIKYGGSAMKEERLKHCFAEDVVLMKFVGINPVIVHGGGPQIGEVLKRLGKETRFVGGLRITDSETMEIVEMVLMGKINKELVNVINQHGGRAVGLSGKDGALFLARKFTFDKDDVGADRDTEDLGFVGEIEAVNPEIIQVLDDGRFIPVIAPIGVDNQGQTYNINADIVAGRLAVSLEADKLILLTDVPGIIDSSGHLISSVSTTEVEDLLQNEIVSGGMIPKVRCCTEAVKGGVRKSHIIDGRIEHAVLLEIFTDVGIGTEIYANI